jgi:hypothetical protein
MANIYNNQNVVKIIGDLYATNKLKGIDGFQKAIGELNSSFNYSDGKSDFRLFSIKSNLQNGKKAVFDRILKELGFECKYDSHGDCDCKYVG